MATITIHPVAEATQRLRRARGWSQRHLAQRLSRIDPVWTTQRVIRLENGRIKHPSPGDYQALSVVFAVSVDDLVWGDLDPSNLSAGETGAYLDLAA
jgi:transcriptional regulator with XRE-family HTH domain